MKIQTIFRKMYLKDIDLATKIYISAYNNETWKENNTYEETYNYLNDFSKKHSAYVLEVNNKIIGLCLCILIPCIGNPYLRIEDFCIGKEYHRKGYGKFLMKEIEKEATNLNCDSILLGTQRDLPSFPFYISQNFIEINSSLLYKDLTK